MKRLIAALLLAAVALTFATTANASVYSYGTIPVHFCTGCGTTTGGGTDSTEKAINLAVGIDTSVVIAVPNDWVFNSGADSVSAFVVVNRVSAGAATDSIYVNIEMNYGGSTWILQTRSLADVGQVGANTGGAIAFFPSKSMTVGGTNIINSYVYVGRGFGARQIRLRVTSLTSSAVTNPPKYSVLIRYPKILQ
jgi:hypothetical protein